jgi:hypothetical protein
MEVRVLMASLYEFDDKEKRRNHPYNSPQGSSSIHAKCMKHETQNQSHPLVASRLNET